MSSFRVERIFPRESTIIITESRGNIFRINILFCVRLVAQLANKGWHVCCVVRKDKPKKELFPKLVREFNVKVLVDPDIEQWAKQGLNEMDFSRWVQCAAIGQQAVFGCYQRINHASLVRKHHLGYVGS